MALPNTAQLTSQLAKMPDQALKQMAMMHKNDPYTLPLIIAEDGRRKELRQASMLAQAQPQAKVVDQEIAAMGPLPEQQGIGMLPVPNMARMADGGIAGMPDGSDASLQYDNEPVLRMADGGHVPRYNGNTTDGSAIWDPTAGEWVDDGSPSAYSRFGSWLGEKFNYGKGLNIDPAGGLRPPGAKQSEGSKKLNADRDAAMAQVNGTGYTRGAMQNDPRLAGYALPSNVTSDSVPVGAAPTPDTGAQRKPLPPGPTGAGGAGAGGGYEKKFLDMFKDDTTKADRLKEIEGIDKPVLEKMQSLIDDNKAKLKSEKEENFYMSLIQGGLAAAGASGPHALQNLAQGFEKGAAHYSEGLKDLRKAAQENSKMEMAMSQYEASGKKDALKSYYEHQDKMMGYKASGLATLMGQEIHAGATLGAANISAGATKDYLNAIRGGNMIESVRKNIATDVQKSMPYATDAEREAAFQKKWMAALQTNPALAQLTGSATGGGGAPGLSAADAALVNKYAS